MLLRTVARAVSGRGSPAAFRRTIALSQTRQYAKADKPQRGIPKSGTFIQDNTRPSRNETWAPEKVIKASSKVPQIPEDGQPFLAEDPPLETAEQENGKRRTEAKPQSIESDYSVDQPEFETVAKPEAVSSTSTSSANPKSKDPQTFSDVNLEPETSSTSTGRGKPLNLPDLRQGIPSAFNADFSDSSSSFKSKDADPPSLEVTEDPASGGRKRGKGDLPDDAYVSSIERKRNKMARFLYIGFAVFAATGAVFLGQDWESEDEAKLHPEIPDGWSPSAFYGRIKVRLSKSLGYYTEPAFPKLLPDVDPAPPYTLVLSLEDLLVSSKWNRHTGWEVAKRPGVDYFLRYLSQYYELVIFTSVQMMNADLVIRKLDPYRMVMWPLFREATRYMNGEHVKDLSYLNRDLSKTIIVDTVPAHVQLQPSNAIVLPKWNGAPKDERTGDLVALIPFLEYIATMSISDVRKVIESYEGCDNIPAEFARRDARAREAFHKQRAEEAAKNPRKGGFGLASALGFKPNQGALPPGEISPAEAYAAGKTISDQMRERGIRQYQALEKEIRENGEKWLEEMAREEKKAQEEQMKSMQSGMAGMFGGVFGGSEKK